MVNHAETPAFPKSQSWILNPDRASPGLRFPGLAQGAQRPAF